MIEVEDGRWKRVKFWHWNRGAEAGPGSNPALERKHDGGRGFWREEIKATIIGGLRLVGGNIRDWAIYSYEIRLRPGERRLRSTKSHGIDGREDPTKKKKVYV